MYLDISFKKMLPLVTIGVALYVLLVATFAAKDLRYGSTPFYSAVALGWQQITGYTFYPAERAVRDFFAALFGATPASAQFDATRAAAIPVITYHRLIDHPDEANVTFPNFKDQMEALSAAGWDTITLEEYEAFMRGEIELPARSILLTFDDGAKQSYYPVDPILKTLGFNAVNYIILGDMVREETTYYLSPQEIQNMLATGRWEIGSHSVAGHNAYAVDARGTEGHFFSDKLWVAEEGRIETDEEFAARIETDLRQSRTELERAFGTAINGFAFPFGDTGETSVNYPASHDVVVQKASDVYDYGWVQPGKGQYTFNYPHETSFLQRRIRVHPEWSGADLIEALDRGIGKTIPYEDALKQDRGWLLTWGSFELLPDGILFSATEESNGASAFLDGTGGWEDYEAMYSGNWHADFAVVMTGIADSRNYDDCAFTNGAVSIRSMRNGVRTTVARTSAPIVASGEGVKIGMRTRDGIVQCIYGDTVVLEASGDFAERGGTGLQVWSAQAAKAEFLAMDLSVRGIADMSLPSPVPVQVPKPSSVSLPAIPDTGDRPQEPLQQVSGASSFGASTTQSTGTVVAPRPTATTSEVERLPAGGLTDGESGNEDDARDKNDRPSFHGALEDIMKDLRDRGGRRGNQRHVND